MVVAGARASLEAAQSRKREGLDVVDGVVAAEIHKLPDLNLSDAVQRVPGVQIVRHRGEGSLVSVRGLTQVLTTLNGREVFTAGSGRTLDCADIATEMLAGIDVYKSSSARRIEGGVGGTVDLRTRRPFDFADGATVLGARWMRGELVGRDAGQLSALASRRFAAAGGGEFGALVNLVLQDRAWREDQKGSGTPTVRDDLLPGESVVVPSGTSETTSLGERRRGAASLVLQWRPTPALEWTAEAHHAELRTRQDSHQVNASATGAVVPGSLEVGPEGDLRRVTWIDAPVSVLSFARDTVDRTRQLALGGRWQGDALALSGDLSHTKSRNHLYFSGPFLAGTAPRFTHDLTGAVPATNIAGTDLLDPANLRYTGLAYRERPFEGDLAAARLDAELERPGELFDRLELGWRRARRRADNAPGLIFADAAIDGLTAADTPGRVTPNPFDDFLDGRAPSIGDYLIADLGNARDAQAIRDAFGITPPIPDAGNPLGVWTIRETTQALYLQAGFAAAAAPLDGRVGLRAVRTGVAVEGTQSLPSSGSTAPIETRSSRTDWLPNLDLRYRPGGGWQLRAAASRTVARPDFSQLSPSLVLVRNSITPSLNQGGAGNPGLLPVRAHGLDLAVERYAGPGRSASLTLFWKRLDGVIATIARDEVHDGETYSVSRPYNRDPADVRGLELAWQRFFDFLPGAWRGLGALPVHTRGYGWLDAALGLRLGEQVTLTLEGSNLLRTLRRSHYGAATRPASAWVNDRQLALGLSVRF